MNMYILYSSTSYDIINTFVLSKKANSRSLAVYRDLACFYEFASHH